MFNLEYLLAEHYLFDKIYNSYITSQPLTTDNDEIKLKVGLLVGDKEKSYSVNLLKKLWCNIEHTYNLLVATRMLRDGYHLITVEGGWLVVNALSPNDRYDIYEDSCTCHDFVYRLKGSAKCKHLKFRDWHLQYRSRIAALKSLNLGN